MMPDSIELALLKGLFVCLLFFSGKQFQTKERWKKSSFVTALLKKTVIHSVVKPGRINLCVTFSEGLCEGSWVDGFQLLCFCFSFYFLTQGFMQPKLVSAQHIAQTGLEHRILLCPTAKFISVHCHAWLSSALFRQMKIRKLCLCPCLGINSRPAESLPVSKGMNWSEW